MILHATRDHFTRTTTLSTLAIEYDGAMRYGPVLGAGGYSAWHEGAPRGPLPFGFICEDEDRGLDAADPAECKRLKIRKETAIPVGRYQIRHTWSPKYEGMVMEVLNVPAFVGIRVHPGTSEIDTEGCILPGLTRDMRRGFVMQSTKARDWLDARVRECEARNEPVYLHIARDPAAWAAFEAKGGADGVMA